MKTLEFMAANMLSANPKKTEFLMIRPGRKQGNRRIKIGGAAVQEMKHARLLGLTEDKQQSHLEGTCNGYVH